MSMDRKKLVMLAPYFVPDRSSGTHRTLGLANYLVKQNWEVTVVTVTESDIAGVDASLYSRLEPQVRILRIPLMDVIQKAQTLLLRTQGRKIRKSENAGQEDKIDASESYFQINSRAMRWLWPIYMPDKKLQWALYLVCSSEVRQLTRGSDCIYSSGPPHSVHITAALLKKLTHVPWVADLRDPWGNNPLQVYPNQTVALKYDSFVEKKVLGQADYIVANTPMMAEDLKKRLVQLSSKITCIANGYECTLFSEDGYFDRVDPEHLNIVHVGTLYGQRDIGPLLKALAILQRNHPNIAKDFHFEFIGPGSENYLNRVAELGLDQLISLNGPVSFEVALTKDTRASVCLCLGLSRTDNQVQVPAKLYQFIALGKPVLALASKKSGIALVLMDSGLDYFLADPSDSDAILTCLMTLHGKWKNKALVYGGNTHKRTRFDRRNMAKALERVLWQVCSRRKEYENFRT